MATPEYKIRLTGDANGLRTAVKQAETSLKSLSSELTSIKSLASGALSFAGIGIGVSELIKVADQYGQITARLQLATRTTGDFAEVQQLLRQAAQDTRAPLVDTVALYAQLAPALQGLGRNSKESVGVISTINQAIALSGSSSEAAAAALTQLGQGFASGVLRGEELNSVLEQTPALARAIAEGLGVSVGELRRLGSEGQLTAERVVQALEKVAGRVDEDFKSLPITVGQSITLLNNAFTEFIGATDQASGASGALARSIAFVGEGLKNLAGSGETLRPFINFVVDAIDGVSRLFRIIGTGIAGYTLAIQQALSGNLDAAVETYRNIGAEVEKILNEPLANEQGRRQAIDNAKAQAQERMKIETELAEKVAQLENLRAVAAGKANASILADADKTGKARRELERKAQQEEMKGAERLRDALRNAWQQSIEGARTARAEAASLLQQAASARQSGTDRAQDRRMRGMSEDERDIYARRQSQDLRDQASRAATFAQNAALRGDLERAAQLSAEAAKYAERAEKYADQISDDDTAANLLEDLGRIREDALKAQAKVKEQEAANLEEVAQRQSALIAEQEERIKNLRAELEKPITLQADITAAETTISALQKQLAEIKDKTVTVTVKTVNESGQPTETRGPSTEFFRGGYTGPGSKYQPAGIVHAGEHVQPMHIVSEPGALAFLERIRREGFRNAMRKMRMPGYATGGLVRNLNAGHIAPRMTETATSKTPIILQLPDGRQLPMTATDDVAKQVAQVFKRAALARGNRK